MLALVSLSMLLAAPQHVTYGAAVTFEGGKCTYWTGDVGFSATEFREDLQSRFDMSNAISIGYQANVPARCVKEAERQARLAGFKDVKTQADPHAGPVGPGG
ncbi:MAG: hypothetical protein ACAH11_00805 [Sphingomonas sp.]